MSPDLILWVLARSSGTAASVALSLSLISGIALRAGVLAWLTQNRGVRVLHDFTSVLWLPLGLAHVITLLLDPTAHIGLVDLVIPFRASYGWFAVGLGTISLQLLVVVMLSTWLRRHQTHAQWLALHRLSYLAFATLFAHTLLAGTDFTQPLVARLAWATALILCAAGAVRLGRAVAHEARSGRPAAAS
ncbi:MAG: hypothetical protein ABR525_05840 [Candidatus Limnocylindria bacterium]